jgi:hypothetical protein
VAFGCDKKANQGGRLLRKSHTLAPRYEPEVLDSRRRSNEESQFCGHAMSLQLLLNCNSRDSEQNGEGMNGNCRSVTVYRDANSAATRALGCNRMYVGRFERTEGENQENGA